MTKLSRVEGIGIAYAHKLAKAGASTAEKFLEAATTSQGRAQLAEACGISPKQILNWANMVDLLRIKGIGGQYAELLHAAGVDTVPELAQRNAATLYEKMKEINLAKNMVRQLPSKRMVMNWVETAKQLPRTLQY